MNKLICPYCNQKDVEAVQACGSSTYFCSSCKKLVSKEKLKEVNSVEHNKKSENEERA